MSIDMRQLKTYLWQKDHESNFISCCEGLARLANLDSPTNIIGINDNNLIWRDRARQYRCEDDFALSGSHYSGYQLQTTSEGTLQVFVTKCPLLNKAGDIKGTIGSSIDITNYFIEDKGGRFDAHGCLRIKVHSEEIILTRTEVKILSYIICGYSSEKIGHLVCRSPRTIECHIHSLKKKCQCATKGDLIVFSIQNNLSYLCHSHREL